MWTFIVALWLLSLRDFTSVVLVSLATLAVAVTGARVNVLHYLRTVGLLLTGGVFLVFFQGVFHPGAGIDVWVFHFSYEGMELGITLALRTFGIVASSFAFSRTTKPKEVSLALIKLGMPYRLAHVGYLGLRFLPLLEADIQALKDAQKLRGVKQGWGKITKTIIALIATELRRVEETAIALETRAFGLHEKQTVLEEVIITKDGVILVAITTAIIIAQLIWRRIAT